MCIGSYKMMNTNLMKNKKLSFGIIMMTVGVALSFGTTGATGIALLGVGVVFFLMGMLEVRKERESKK